MAGITGDDSWPKPPGNEPPKRLPDHWWVRTGRSTQDPPVGTWLIDSPVLFCFFFFSMLQVFPGISQLPVLSSPFQRSWSFCCSTSTARSKPSLLKRGGANPALSANFFALASRKLIAHSWEFQCNSSLLNTLNRHQLLSVCGAFSEAL